MFGQIMACTMHFRTVLNDASEITLVRFNEFMTAAHNWWVNVMMPNLNAEYTYFATAMSEISGFTVGDGETEPEWDEVNLTFGQVGLDTSDLGVAATIMGDPLPTTVAAVINMNTGLAGRRNRGRMKLGGLSEADNASFALMGAVTQAALQADFTTLIDDGLISATPSNSQMVPVVFSKRKLHFLALGQPPRLASEQITEAVVTQNWGQQRSRRQALTGA